MPRKNKFDSGYVKKRWNNRHAHSSRGHYTGGGKKFAYGYCGWCTPPGQRTKRSISRKGVSTKLKNKEFKKQCNSSIQCDLNDECWEHNDFIHLDHYQYDEYQYNYNDIPIWNCSMCSYQNVERLFYCSFCNHPYFGNQQQNEKKYSVDSKYSESIKNYQENHGNTKMKLNEMNISKKGKNKIIKYQILHNNFLCVLQTLHSIYFLNNNYWSQSLLHHVKLSEIAKYRMFETEIICVVPEYILKRLDLIFYGYGNTEKSFIPQIVYITKQKLFARYYQRSVTMKKRINEIKKDMVRNNEMIRYYLELNKVIICGFGKYYYKQSFIPKEINELIMSFYGSDSMNIFNLLSPDNKNNIIVSCNKSLKCLSQWIGSNKDIFICLSLHQKNSLHFVIPVFNVKFNKIHNNRQKSIWI